MFDDRCPEGADGSIFFRIVPTGTANARNPGALRGEGNRLPVITSTRSNDAMLAFDALERSDQV